MLGLVFAKDGFSQLVEVETGAGAIALAQIDPQLVLFGRKNHILCFVAQPGYNPGHDQLRHLRGHQAGLFPHGEVVWDPVLLDEVFELVRNPGRIAAAEGLVGQRYGQSFAERIFHHAYNFGTMG